MPKSEVIQFFRELSFQESLKNQNTVETRSRLPETS